VAGEADRRRRAADRVRADIHADVVRVLAGEWLMAIQVECPTRWRAGRIRLTVPAGYEGLIGEASSVVIDHLPDRYYLMLDCGAGS